MTPFTKFIFTIFAGCLLFASLTIAMVLINTNQDIRQQASDKITICHQTNEHQITIQVNITALQTHLDHGDTQGPCPGDSFPTPTSTTLPPTSPPTPILSSPDISCNNPDINLDGIVDIIDFALLSANFQSPTPNPHQANINCDNLVDIIDFAILSNNYLKQ